MERSFILTIVDFTKQVHFESYFSMSRRCGENFTSKGEPESLRVVDCSKSNFTSFG